MTHDANQPWIVGAAASLTFGFIRGLHTSFGVFFVALLDAFHWSRGVTAGLQTANLVTDAVVSPFIGRLTDRLGPRRVVMAGGIVLAAGLVLCSQVRTAWELYFYFGVIVSLGFATGGVIPHVVVVSEWFPSRRGLVLGIVYGAVGVGTLILSPLSQWLISLWGWPRVFQALAATILIVIVPLVWSTYRPSPKSTGAARGAVNAAAAGEWSASLALRSIQFWSVFISRMLGSVGTMLIVTHQVAHVVDIGYSHIWAAGVFGVMAFVSAGGRVAFGYLADALTKTTAYTLNIACAAVGVLALTLATDTSQPWLLYVYVGGFGIAFGSRAVILSAITADIFAGRGFGTIFGFSVVSVGVGGGLGAWLGGALHDLTGDYVVSFNVANSLLLISVLAVWITGLDWMRRFDRRLWPGNPPGTTSSD